MHEDQFYISFCSPLLLAQIFFSRLLLLFAYFCSGFIFFCSFCRELRNIASRGIKKRVLCGARRYTLHTHTYTHNRFIYFICIVIFFFMGFTEHGLLLFVGYLLFLIVAPPPPYGMALIFGQVGRRHLITLCAHNWFIDNRNGGWPMAMLFIVCLFAGKLNWLIRYLFRNKFPCILWPSGSKQ